MLNIIFPRFCTSCQNTLLAEEDLFCGFCINDLPFTRFHYNEDETVLNKFYGLLKVEQATSFLYFEKMGITQKILHQLKYKGRQEIGRYFGEWFGRELSEIESYQNIDFIVPVPLHKARMRQRGYNQVALFAIALAEQLNATYDESALIKISGAKSQVGLGRRGRMSRTEIFKLAEAPHLKDKHILLVDDLITTGGTLQECGKELHKAEINKLSIATLAMT